MGEAKLIIGGFIMKVSEIFHLIAELALKLGIKSIKDLSGCWEYQIDDRWKIFLNGHNKPMEIDSEILIKPYHCYIKYNGWPAGMINPKDGWMVDDTTANENTLIMALKKAIKSK